MDGNDASAFKHRQRQLWSIGDYPSMAAQLDRAARDLVDRLGVGAGMRVLDVGTGSGNAALAAARAGADVVGVDLTPEQFDEADGRAAELGLEIEWDEGDAEALPYPDESFDRVVSAFSLMFAPRPDVAAGELLRVLRPGGRFVVCNWVARGIVATVVDAVGVGGLPPAGSLMPWGEPDYVRGLFGGAGAIELDFADGAVEWMFPSADDAVRWLEEVSGPIIAIRAGAGPERWAAIRARLVGDVAGMVRDDLPGVWVSAPYLVALGAKPN